MGYTRYAVYYVPPEGPLAEFGASWLGWDLRLGRASPQPGIAGLDAITARPRKYGFHATLKPPFRLVDGADPARLASALADLARTTAPARCNGLQLSVLGRFLALTALGDPSELRRVADACVRNLDPFRAPLTEADRARRRSGRLTARQEALLETWGYPFVMDNFRFHMTLSGPLPGDMVAMWQEEAGRHLPPLPAPFVLDRIALCGEREDGCFEMIGCHVLTGGAERTCAIGDP